ncbi:MAG: MepB family protein [Burkholderiales bacterium]|nr:MepB family protein [Burkholderiales bacterium]
MHKDLCLIDEVLLNALGMKVSDFCNNIINKNYLASSFSLGVYHCVFREANLTPNKLGCFVALWKRPLDGDVCLSTTIPYGANDFDFCWVFVRKDERCGVFIFPNSILQLKQILSNNNTSGKRGFRLYPEWDSLTSKQAINTQNWQLDYFINLTNVNKINFEKFKKIITQKV